MDEQQLLRHIIDDCDEALKDTFLRRMDASISSAKYKLENDKPIFDADHENAIIKKITSGLSPELSRKAHVLWNSLLRMSRGRQYCYFIENNADLLLTHERDIHSSPKNKDGIVLCPENIARTVSTLLNMEVMPYPSIQTALDGAIGDSGACVAIEVSGLYDTEWLYSMIMERPLYVNYIAPTKTGTLLVVMSKNIDDSPKVDPVFSIAFMIARGHGSMAQALSILSDNRLNIEFMRLKKKKAEDGEYDDLIFLDFSGGINSIETRAALFQMQTELQHFRVLGYREAVEQ